ncbi:MAG: polyprenyl synthetase family protein, partial [Candidatus Micrarchaeota archaeon]|nr:polyprenyl synthetase family protein [Candidatus Micrarchaeota archaeon]
FDKFKDMLDYTLEGQHIENKFIHETKDLSKASEELYLRVIESKTCYYTVYGPMQLGAIAAGQSDDMLKILKEIGTPAGRAFQIVDDLLDMIGDETKTGKKRYGDLYEGKITLPVLYAYKNALPEEKERLNQIYAKKRSEKTQEEIQFIVDLINKFGGTEYAMKRAKEYGEEATALIEKYKKSLPDNEYTQTMLSAIEQLYMREK